MLPKFNAYFKKRFNSKTLPSRPIPPFYSIQHINFPNSRNEITPDRLELLESYTSKLPDQEIYGYFYNTEHYVNALKILQLSTNETRNRIIFFMQKILPFLPHSANILDVGTSPAPFYKLISRLSYQITILDIQRESFDRIPNSLRNKLTFKKENIQEANLPTEYYDAILLSHVLYYCEKALVYHVVEKAFKALKIGGYLVISITDCLDKRKLTHTFNGQNFDIERLLSLCLTNLPAEISYFTSNEAFCAKSLKTACQISGIFLHDFNSFTTREELESFLLANCRKAEDYYEIQAQQLFLVLQKRHL